MFFACLYFAFITKSSLNSLQTDETGSIPISVPINMMKVTGSKSCVAETTCPEGKDATLAINCGQKCTSTNDHLVTYEYTFEGDMFQVYGTYDSQFHEYDIYVDNAFFATIDQNRQTRSEYALQYTSHPLEYGEHTIKIKGKGQVFEIYKIAYWPSYKAIRVDSIDIKEPWVKEGDKFGGYREWANSGNAASAVKTLTVKSSKFWIIGSYDNGHGNLKITIDDMETKEENTASSTRIDFAVLHCTDDLPFTEHTLKLQFGSGGVCINCVYYLPYSAPTPTPVPLSIPINTMIVEGSKSCNTQTQCPQGQDVQLISEPCGEKCLSTNDHHVTYQYQFTGDKFQVYGTYDPSNHEYEVYLDDVLYTKIDQNKETKQEYALQYTSPVFDYGLHTIKIAGKGEQFEFYKITYWPSFEAIRVNSTDIKVDWKKEGDKFGGHREWANEGNLPNAVKNLTISCIKVWLIGSKDTGHGDLKFTADGAVTNINTRADKRIDFTVLYETELLLADIHTFLLQYGSGGGVCINCFFYLPCPTPEPTPEPVSSPVPVPINMMKVTGSKSCNIETTCPEGNDATLAINCGQKCTSTGDHLVIYEYTFKGDTFQVYGTYDSQLFEYDVYVDDVFLATVNQNRQTRSEYALQYTSHSFEYGEHTIKIKGKGQAFEIYKIAYWPSYKAIRVDSIDIKEPWNKEGDKFGGYREWANSASSPVKTLTVKSSKFWIIGSYDNGHGNLKITIDDMETKEENTASSTRIDFAVLHCTDDLPFTEHTLKLQFGSGGVCINCVYYLPEEIPIVPEPVDIPISIPISAMTVQGGNSCGVIQGDDCPTGENAAMATKPCGQRCWSTDDNKVYYEYVFTGELVQVYGTFDPQHHKFAVFIDNEYRAVVNQNSDTREPYALMYTSNLLEYGVHKIRVAGIGEVFELYKIAFWPSIKAKRLNFTEFDKNGEWKSQADGFGGITNYVDNVEGATATKFIYCEKFWVYGSKDSTYSELYIQFGDFNTFFDEETSVHKDFVLVYESPLLPYRIGDIVFTTKGTVKVNCIYYHDEAPNPSESPTQSATESPTETPTESATESATESPTESATETPTESATESATESPTESATETPTESATESATESPTESATESATESPTESVSQTPCASATPASTETPLPSPTEKPPELIIVNESDLIDDKRIEKIVNDTNPIKISVEISNFTDIKHNDDGGAIHIENSGIICDKTIFTNCSSEKVGGAIYVKNTIEQTNEITLEGLSFYQCKANYGGAVYIYTSSEKNMVKITRCTFTENEANIASDGTPNQKFGGSAIFLTSRKGVLMRNRFLNNKGSGSSVMLYNIFDDQTSLNLLDNERGSVVVSDCEFNIDKEQKCSLFYVGGIHGSLLQLNGCKFTGELGKDSHYIDGLIVDDKSPKLDVKNCKFDGDVKNSFLKKNFLSIDLNLKNNSKVNSPNNYSYKVAFIAAFAVGFVAIIVLIVIKKSQINFNENDNEMQLN